MQKLEQLESEVVWMTPSLAKQILAQSAGNRRIRMAGVRKYANEMSSGNWSLACTIKISKDGKLLDGHHTLTSVIKSGVSVQMHIVRGYSEDIRHGLNTTINDNIKDKVFEEDSRLVGLVAEAFKLYHDNRSIKEIATTEQVRTLTAKLKPTFEAFVKDNKKRVAILWKSPALLAAVYAHTISKNSQEVVDIFTRLNSSKPATPIELAITQMFSNGDIAKSPQPTVFHKLVTVFNPENAKRRTVRYEEVAQMKQFKAWLKKLVTII